ncbi:Ldh family oxidoreductase [Teichococcus aestuarii]|uniref:Ldh family oxidoreductase n=1 Tax=Teichococcus aestuarii TaxID=568898 RepID=UPI00361A4F19
MVDAGDGPILDSVRLTGFCRAVFERVGMPEAEAALCAESLVEADLRGVASHGVVRLPIYAERLERGANNPRAVPRVLRETRGTAVVDGDNGMGQVVGAWAMEVALRKAREGEPAWVSVRNSNHFGAAAWFAEYATRAEMIGIAITIGGINHMVPWGGAEALLGNNPFAIGMPMRGAPPMMLDMACSVAARGKIIVAAKEGTPIPPDWAVDRDGVPTTDAARALEGFVSPLGGPKGYALTLTMGLLSTMLSGAAFGREVTHMYEDFARPQNVGHLFAVLPVTAFEDLDTYYARMETAAAELRGARKAPGVARIHLPGEREALLRQARLAEGVPVAAAVMEELVALGLRLGVPPLK